MMLLLLLSSPSLLKSRRRRIRKRVETSDKPSKATSFGFLPVMQDATAALRMTSEYEFDWNVPLSIPYKIYNQKEEKNDYRLLSFNIEKNVRRKLDAPA